GPHASARRSPYQITTDTPFQPVLAPSRQRRPTFLADEPYSPKAANNASPLTICRRQTLYRRNRGGDGWFCAAALDPAQVGGFSVPLAPHCGATKGHSLAVAPFIRHSMGNPRSCEHEINGQGRGD